jgi:hypothetical protein
MINNGMYVKVNKRICNNVHENTIMKTDMKLISQISMLNIINLNQYPNLNASKYKESE